MSILDLCHRSSLMLVNRLKSMVGMSVVSQPVNRHADINIFTVASGLLYEVSDLTYSFILADTRDSVSLRS